MTEQEVARKLLKYEHALSNKQKEIAAINEDIKKYKNAVAKLEAGLIKKLQVKNTDCKVGRDHFYLSATPGKIIVPDVNKIPKWAQKKTIKIEPNLTMIKARLKEEKITEDEEWFTFEKGVCLKHKVMEEDE